MNLFLLRHAPAAERGTAGFADDSARPLTPAGRRELKTIPATLKKMDLDFDLILSSPFLRAKQTAEIVAAELKLKKRLKFTSALEPEGDQKKLIAELTRLKPPPENLLLVGHEPDLSRLISRLVTGRPDAGFALKKSGLAKLEIEKLHLGQCATLAWLLTPKLMKLG